jgi:hypothetical protein
MVEEDPFDEASRSGLRLWFPDCIPPALLSLPPLALPLAVFAIDLFISPSDEIDGFTFQMLERIV